MTEARIYHRYRIPFPLSYSVEDGKESVFRDGNILDVSEGGVYIQVDAIVQEGVNIKLFIEVGGRKFRLAGKVIRSNSDKADQQNGLAINFTKVSDVFKMRMIEQVVKIEEYRLWKTKQMGYQVEEYEVANEWITRFRKKQIAKAL